MHNNLSPLSQADESDKKFNFREQMDKYLIHWKWFMLSVIICMGLSFLYLRYSTPLYSISSTILIKDDKKGGLPNEFSTFADLGLMTAMKSNVDNEVEVLKARTLSLSTVKELGFNITYFAKGNIKVGEVYNHSPIRATFF